MRRQALPGALTPPTSRRGPYYTEGERLLGSSPSSLFYGIDQLGSVRRVFASPTSAPAYGYDPYGVPLQTTAPLTDFGYAGLFNEPDSGLGLATYRAYDPRVGRWISRDPIGERGSRAGNLYAYADGNPIFNKDFTGLASGGTPGNNQAQNKQVTDICRKLGLNKDQRRMLHDAISGQNLGYHEILDIATDMFQP